MLEADRGHLAVPLIKAEKPDLVLLDILLPEHDGIEICEEIRSFSTVPIIFLSSKAEEIDTIIGLTVGADDYIVKPFSPRELGARIRTLLRRQKYVGASIEKNEQLLIFPNIQIDLQKYTVSVNESLVHLSSKEFGLLSYLAKHPGQVFTTEQLFEAVWGEPSIEETRTVLVHISSLRKKNRSRSCKAKLYLDRARDRLQVQ